VVASLDSLLDLQERDLALDRLRHRHATLPERTALASAEAHVDELGGTIEVLRAQRDDIAREEKRFDDEAIALAEQAALAEKRLYSGEISSPRELQALQTDVEQLKRHQRGVEDRQLAAMEQREPLDARLAELDAELGASETAVSRCRDELGAAEAAIAAEMATESSARDGIAAGIDADLVADYERRRVNAKGAGAARLVGNTCQGCHLTIPATEVDRIRKGAAGTIAYCDNCGCILVP
jgi:hypothetical protein